MSSFWKPSQFIFHDRIPFVGLLGKSEVEAAAAVIVRATQVLGDEWRPISSRDIGERLLNDERDKILPWAKLVTNPFWYPDVRKLVEKGFARLVDPAVEWKSPVMLTEKFFDRVNVAAERCQSKETFAC